METDYSFRLTEPGESLRVYIKQTDKKKDKVLIACQTGQKQLMNTKQLAINFLIHPMMTFKIILSIHFEALKLWKKGAIFKKRKIKNKNANKIPTNITTIKCFNLDKEKDFMSYGSSSKNVYLLLLEDL